MMLLQSFGSPAWMSAIHTVRRAIDIDVIGAATNPITYFLSRFEVGTLSGSPGNLDPFVLGFSDPEVHAYVDGIDRRLVLDASDDHPPHHKAYKRPPPPSDAVPMT
jgi:hypothetical protein